MKEQLINVLSEFADYYVLVYVDETFHELNNVLSGWIW